MVYIFNKLSSEYPDKLGPNCYKGNGASFLSFFKPSEKYHPKYCAIFIGEFFFFVHRFFSKKFFELYFVISQSPDHSQEFRELEKVDEKLRFSMKYIKF